MKWQHVLLCVSPSGFYDRLRAEVRLLGTVHDLGIPTNETVQLLQVSARLAA